MIDGMKEAVDETPLVRTTHYDLEPCRFIDGRMLVVGRISSPW
jgi:hypothetical protein